MMANRRFRVAAWPKPERQTVQRLGGLELRLPVSPCVVASIIDMGAIEQPFELSEGLT